MRTRSTLAALAALAILATPVFAAGPFAQVATGSTSIDFHPTVSGIELSLTVSGPEGFYFQQRYDAGQTASFDLFDAAGEFVPAGSYTWELRAAPELSDAERAEMADLRAAGSDGSTLQKSGKLAGYEPMSGAFRVEQGAIVAGGQAEEAGAPAGENRLATKDQVIADDLIVIGSECVGVDCANGENFGFDTIRLKENNLRIKFMDTSVGSFPTNDWQIAANDSANGGASYLAIEDVDAGRTPFRVEAGARNNALVVESDGDIGIGTLNPAVDVEVVTGNTPTLRLQQDGSSGFTPQTWDLAGNEANFFVRDVTNGSGLPFRIEPGADTNSLYIDSTNNVGVGTNNPTGALHVKDGASDVFWADTTGVGIGTSSPDADLDVESSTEVTIRLTRSDLGRLWDIENDGPLQLNEATDPDAEFSLTQGGNLTIQGNLTEGSSREIKWGFAPIDSRDILTRVTEMPLSTWIYDGDTARHIGPMAEDFHAAFQLGPDDKHIAPSDKAGVALAAIQGLTQVVEEKDQQIEALRAEVEELKRLVRDLAEKDGAH